MNLARRFLYPLVLGLVLLTQVAEVCPRLHDHEISHACTQYDGQFVYFDEVDGVERSVPDQPVLEGINLGKSHDHHECALCHLNLYAHLAVGLIKIPVTGREASAKRPEIHIPEGAPTVLRSRGPPLQIV